MGKADGRLTRRMRRNIAWALTLLLVGAYALLPKGEDGRERTLTEIAEEPDDDATKLDIIDIDPPTANPSSAIVITFVGAKDPAGTRAFEGRTELPVLARRKNSLVARLPEDLEPGRAKIRVKSKSERSKPFDLKVTIPDWRKPFRELVGGFALLLFGIGIFARGVREATGMQSLNALARWAGRGPAALALGAVTGVLVQSTTAAAGLLAGLVASSVLAVAPAATAFLGAQLGAATAPLVTGLLDPKEGLLVITVGLLWLGLAADRRSTAVGRLVLGAGLIAFGLQTMRPGFEIFTSSPALLSAVSHFRADTLANTLTCAAAGALLVALLQGPAPVLVLVLVLAQTTGEWDLRTALAVLAGSGLGASIGALVTTPTDRRCRRLAPLHLLLGVSSTVLAVLTLDVWVAIADRIVAGTPDEIRWGKRVRLPNIGGHFGVAFAMSQTAVALLLLPVVPFVARWLERRWPESPPSLVPTVGDPVAIVRNLLLGVLKTQQDALGPLSELAIEGNRQAGRAAEHYLADARSSIESTLSGPARLLPKTLAGEQLTRVTFACVQFERSLEALLYQAEKLVDERVAASEGGALSATLHDEECEILLALSELLSDGVRAVSRCLGAVEPIDLESARAREIRMNTLETRARHTLLSRAPASPQAPLVASRLSVLEMIGAYEAAGNQLYRLSEAFDATYSPRAVAASN